MADIILLENHRGSIAYAAKTRLALLDRIDREGRLETQAEAQRIAELEDAIVSGQPATAADARAQIAYAQEDPSRFHDPLFDPNERDALISMFARAAIFPAFRAT